jgi:hypothetical protein
LAPLHAERVGFRQAGAWLAEHALPGDEVVDPFAWAGFYAGAIFREGQSGLPAHNPPVCFVVLDEPGTRHPHLRWFLPAIEQRAHSGAVKFRYPVRRARIQSEVVVYEVAR